MVDHRGELPVTERWDKGANRRPYEEEESWLGPHVQIWSGYKESTIKFDVYDSELTRLADQDTDVVFVCPVASPRISRLGRKSVR